MLLFCVATYQSSAQILSDFPCYAVAEDNGAPNFFFEYNPSDSTWTNVGITGTDFIESIATDPINDIIYAVDGGVFGVINAATGTFSATGVLGTANGSEGPILIDDVDGLSYDPANEILWASHRIPGDTPGTNDLLFKIDPATASVIPGEFINGDDYVIVEEVQDMTLNAVVYDVDDIAYNPYTGTLYAIQNQDGPGVISIINQFDGNVEEIIYDFNDDDVEGLGITYLSELYGTTGDNGSTGSQNTFIFIDIVDKETTTLNDIDPSGVAVDFESFDCLTAVNDLALKKEISSLQAQPIFSGDVVTFEITVYNQGDIANQDIVVTDYIPAGLTLADSDWNSVNPQLANYTIPGPLAPGESITFDLQLQVQPSANGTIINYAEISLSFNEDINIANGEDVALPDVDSDPDAVNDESGNIIVDNQLNGSGPNANQDEDDHDVATFAIGTCIATGAEYFPCYAVSEDNGAPNTLYLFDQAQNIWTKIGVTGTEFVESIAADPVNNILYAIDGGTLGRLDVLTGAFTQIATLGTANGDYGSILINDVDGLTYDPINEVLIGSHRIGGDGPGTNDILIKINPITGALINSAFEDSNGDPADYAIIEEAFDSTLGAVVYNVDDIALNPYTAELFAIQNDDGPGIITVINSLNGEIDRDVYDAPDEDLEGLGFNGYGELFATSGDNGSTGSQNSFVAIDYLNQSSFILGPIDQSGVDVDFESFDCFAGYNDLALRETLSAGQQTPFCAGEIVTFEIEVFNQGLLTNENVIITNYFSPEFELVADDVWTDQGNQTATAVVPCPLSPNDSEIFEISFKISDQVACSENAEIVIDNFSEITNSFNPFFLDEDGLPIPLQDIDSEPDSLNDENGIVDNEINEQSVNGDEDDHDIESITVMPANPSAGALSTSNSIVCLSDAAVIISASPNGNILEGCFTATNADDIVVPDGYQLTYVLTEGTALTIVDVSNTPSFTINNSGNYTIHSFVYDSNTLDTSIIELGTTTGFDVNNLLIQGGGSICAALNVEGVSVSVSNPMAGTLTAVASEVCFNGTEALIEATPNGDEIVPANYSTIYVLTSGTDLVIEAVDATPQFTVANSGKYTIHTLIYYPATLDLSTSVTLGQTTGGEVNSLLEQGGGDICAALDVAGASFTVQNPNAGTLTAVSSAVTCLIENQAMLSAETNATPEFPAGYEVIYVLTSGSDLIIEATSASPNFTVMLAGDYTIHTLVYNPNTLDLSTVTPGQTTGLDINSLLVQGGGDICAALDVAGVPFNIGGDIAVSFEAGSPIDATCGELGAASIDISGGTAPYQINWSDGFSLEDRPEINAGNYSVTVTDELGCTGSLEVTILGSSTLELAITETCELTVSGSDALLDYTVTGGNGPYTVEVVDAAGNRVAPDETGTAPVWNSLSQGQYEIQVSDVDGCSTRQSFVICPYSCQLEGTLEEIVEVSCSGGNNGSITISATTNPGADPIQYVWLGGDGAIIENETQPTITNITAGTYEVRLIDANGCTDELIFEVIEPPAFVFADCNSDDVTTTGGTDGTATVIVNGGVTPYTYLWSDGQTTNPANNLGAGTFDVTVTDSNGCEIQATCTVQSPSCSDFNVDFNTSQVSCFNESDGVVEISATGTAGTVTYSWTPNVAAGPLASNLSAGMYQVFVVDAVGCEETITAEILEPAELAGVIGKSDVVCFAEDNGTLDLQASGGTEPYEYAWSNGVTTEDQTDVGPGIFTVTIKDLNGCTIVRSDTILEPTELIFSENLISNVSCNELSNGSISVTVEGGAAPYQYLWSNGETNPVFSGYIAGIYSLTVFDNNGCTLDEDFEITEPEVLTVVNCSPEDATSTGGMDGTATIVVSGGTAPYNYLWSDGQTTNPAENLVAGTYDVVVTDANGCEATVSCTIQEPSCGGYELSETNMPVGCFSGNDGSIEVSVSNASGNINYNWSPDVSNSALATGLTSGSYEITAIDGVGCEATITVEITEPAELAGTITKTDVKCFEQADGLINTEINGGTNPLQYLWSNGATTSNIENIESGSYTVTVTDANGCILVLTEEVVEPEELVFLDSNLSNVSCNGFNDGIITVSVNGGVAPLSYEWSNGANTENISDLFAGSYLLTVTDANGCVIQEEYEITEPELLLAVDCNAEDATTTGGSDGTATIIISGGVTPYSYQWSDGQTANPAVNLAAGSYDVAITDANGCQTQTTCTIQSPSCAGYAVIVDSNVSVSCFEGNDGAVSVAVDGASGSIDYTWTPDIATGPAATGLTAGFYEIATKDAVGCEASLTVEVTQPGELQGISEKTDVICFNEQNGSINVNITGGTAPYEYLWSNGDNVKELLNIDPGTYTVTTTDALGCTLVLTEEILQPSQFELTANAIDVSCNGLNDGALIISAQGGVPPYKYEWSNGATSPSLSGAVAGVYSLTIVDDNGCELEENFEITEPEALAVVDCNAEDVSTTQGSDGSATVIISGGTAPYTYLWSDGQTNNPATNLSPGSYDVVVTDANACETQATCTVQSPSCSGYEVSIASNDPVSCSGGDDGAVSIAVEGASGSITYTWLPDVASGPAATGLTAGMYEVTTADAVGCQASIMVQVTQSGALTSTTEKIDVTCFGEQNGSINVDISGGNMPYEYAWSNGDVIEDLLSVGFGTYTLNVTDASGCTLVLTEEIQQPIELGITLNEITDVSCEGANDGAVSVSVNGGIPPYVYEWSNGVATSSLTDAAAGSYSLTITDANSCTVEEDFEIAQPEIFSVVDCNTEDITTTDGTDGTATVVISGGTAPYNYQWSDGQTTNPAIDLPEGSYDIVITDANGCQTQTTCTVQSPSCSGYEVTVASNVSVSCFGEDDGAVSISADGASGSISYTWTPDVATGPAATGLSAGMYEVVAVDAVGCEALTTVEVTQPAELMGTSEKIDVTCFGEQNGSINVDISGGTIPYEYLWSNGDVTEDITNTGFGTYTLNVTDASGCIFILSEDISQPLDFELTLDEIIDVSCNGTSDGAVSIATTGGIPPYVYDWSNGATSPSLSGAVAGNYSLIVTDSNACTVEDDFEITEPEALVVVDCNAEDISTTGGMDGTATVIISGGTAPYNYQWSDGQTTNPAINLGAGSYDVAISDANGCETQTICTVQSPSCAGYEVTVTSNNPVSCFGGNDGAASISVQGASGSINYSWTTDVTAGPAATGLTAGVYEVTAIDAVGCQASITVEVTQPGELNSATEKIDVTCFGEQNGSINVDISGGTMPYEYSWSNGDDIEDLLSVGSGTYTLNVTDASGCTLVFTEEIQQPLEFELTPEEIENASCNGSNDGLISISVNGGTAPYIYEWSNGAASSSISGIGTGGYSVIVTDANSCTIEENFEITEPEALAVVNCDAENITTTGGMDGTTTVVISGGTAPYSYLWSDGQTTNPAINLGAGSYDVVITDANDCETQTTCTVQSPSCAGYEVMVASNESVSCTGDDDGALSISVEGASGSINYTWTPDVATGPAATGLTAGIYEVTAADAVGCQATVTVEVTQPGELRSTTEKNDVTCFGEQNGSINVDISGGTMPYEYSWSNGDNIEDLLNVGFGSYTLNVTDFSGCTLVLTEEIQQPLEFALVSDEINDVTCNGSNDGSIAVSANGGIPPYVFEWSNGITAPGFSGAVAGLYSLTVLDDSGCSSNEDFEIAEPEALVLVGCTSENVTVSEGSDGSVSVEVTGGTSPYTYLWSNGQTVRQATGLTAGSYNVTVTDANACTIETTCTVQEPGCAGFSVSVRSSQQVSCATENDGSIEVSVNGASGAVTYNWSPNVSDGSLATNLAAGTYQVMASDNVGCESSTTVEITQPEMLNGASTAIDVTCSEQANGSISVDLEGGATPYTYLWSNGSSVEDLENVGSGSYTLTVTDGNGCILVLNDEVTEPSLLTVSSSNVVNAGCNSLSDGSISVDIEGGIPPYAYLWSTGQTTQSISDLSAGFYSVTISDSNGCITENDFEITQPEALAFIECNSEDVTTTEGTDGTATAIITGGTAPYTYLWSDGQVTNPAINLGAGSYDVSITDANGCETVGTCTVQGVNCRDFEVGSNINQVSCNNIEDGSIEVLVTGASGIITFQWMPAVSATAIGAGLGAGSYSILVTDGVGCNEVITATLNNPTSINGTITKTDVSCNGANNGSLDLQLSGGTLPYSYSWNNGATEEDLNNQAPGDYSVIVVDSNDCIFVISESIAEPTLLQEAVDAVVSNATCTVDNAGAVDISITGGTTPYAFQWSTGAVTEDINNLTAGNYFVTVTDANNCEFGVGYDVLEPISCSSDLALIVELSPDGPLEFKEGDEVTFVITLFNQGEDSLTNITIVDYIPEGLTLNDPFWSLIGNNTVELEIIGTLAPLSMTAVDITFTVNSEAENGFALNYVEVSGANNSLGDPYQDKDSTPDTINGNDAGAVAGTPTDNTFDGNGIDDEDDHDVASLFIQSFDLALQTTAEGEPGISPGDEFTILVTITNQGSIDAYNITIHQSITENLILNDAAWTQDGNIITTTHNGPLIAGESVTIPVNFILDQNTEPGALVIESELGGATLADGTPANDADSTYDLNFENDAGGAAGTTSDNVIIGDGTGLPGSTDPNTDEDDHDPVIIVVDDLLIDLELDIALDPRIVFSGDVVTWTINVENKGPAEATDVDVSNQFGDDLTYLEDNSNGTFIPESGVWDIGDLAVGESVSIQVLTTVNNFDDMELTSEVLSANEDDVDSTPNNNITGEDDQDSDTPEPFRSVKFADPCNCESGIDISGDGNVDYAYEPIIITSAGTGENWVLTAASGLVSVSGETLNSETLEAQGNGDYLLESYVSADGSSTFFASFEETGTGTTLSITGGPCSPCPLTGGMNNPPDIGPDQRTCTEPVTQIAICVDDFDPDGDNVMILMAETTFNCSIEIFNDTCFTYIPLPGLVNVTDTITVIACDDGQPILCDELTVLVDIKRDCDEEEECENTTILDCTEFITPIEICVPDFCKLDDETEVIEGAETTFNCSIDSLSTNCIKYTPLPGLDNVDTVYIYGSDASGALDTVVAYIIVTEDCDDYYNANDDETSTTVNEPVIINVLENDENNSDCELEDLSISVVNDPSNGEVTLNDDGTFEYTPDDGFIGEDSFEYEVCCLSVCDIAEVTITINEATPMANDDEVSTTVNMPVIIDVLENDDPIFQNCDSDDLTFRITSAPDNGILVINDDGTIEYTPDDGFIGEDSFEYEVCCAEICDVAEVTINVNDDGPKANDDEVSTTINMPVVINVLENDDPVFQNCDSDDLTFRITSAPDNGVLVINDDGTIEYTPDDGFIGEDSFEYEVCCAEICDVAEVTINVNDDGPKANDDEVSTDANTPVSINVLENDDPFFQNCSVDDLTIEIVTQPFSGSVAIFSITNVVYTPNEGFSGQDNFEYKICCAEVCDVAQVTINVDTGPMANDDLVTTDENTPVSINVLQNDDPFFQNCSPDDLIVEIVSNPFSGAVMVFSFDNIAYTPNEGFSGEDSFEYKVCCLDVCDTASVTILVNGLNDPPVAVDDMYETQVGEPVTISILDNDSDPNGDNIEVVFISEPNNGSVVPVEGGTYVYVPDTGFVGIDSFIYVICDDNAMPLCDTATVYITIGDNNPPIIVGPDGEPVDTIFATTLVDTPFDDCITAIDIDGDNIIIDLIQDGSNGMVTFTNDSCFIYTPDPDFVGVDTLIFTACDDGMPPLCDTLIYIIEVVEEDLIPTANPDEETTPINTPVTISVLDNDILEPGEPIVITIEEQPTNGTVEIIAATGEIVYTPDPDFVGLDSFIYQICDSTRCDTAIVFVNVIDEIALELIDDSYNTTVGTSITFNVCDNDIFEGAIEVVFFEQPPMGEVAQLQDQGCEFIYTPNGTGVDCFTYIAQNELGEEDRAEVCITVTDCEFTQNTLTPNGDGINDLFSLDNFLGCCNNSEVMIFNRWGGIVYDNKDVQRGDFWRGEYHSNAGGNDQILPDGTYFYCILCDDVTEEGEGKFTGFIHLDNQ